MKVTISCLARLKRTFKRRRPRAPLDWTEPLVNFRTCRFRTIDCRNENRVEFVTLHIFKVLDEKPFKAAVPFNPVLPVVLYKRIGVALFFHELLNQACLRKVQRDDAKGSVRTLLHVLNGGIGNRFGFDFV